MKIYGHNDVFLMNGGRMKWEAENRQMTIEHPRFNLEVQRKRQLLRVEF